MSKLGPVTSYESNQSNKELETASPRETLFQHPNVIDRQSVVTTPFARLWGKVTFQILSHAWGINRTAFHSHKCGILPTMFMQGVLLVNYTCDHPPIPDNYRRTATDFQVGTDVSTYHDHTFRLQCASRGCNDVHGSQKSVRKMPNPFPIFFTPFCCYLLHSAEPANSALS